MNVILFEDEKLAEKRLRRLIGEVDKNINVLKSMTSVEEGINELKEHIDSTDLIFMDIHLGDGLSFEILEILEVKKPIIFTTAYDQYAIRAFKHNSVSYLLKPIQRDDLELAINKHRAHNQTLPDWNKLKLTLKEGPTLLKKVKNRFLVNIGDKWRSIKTEDIAVFYAENKNCFVKTFDEKRYFVNSSLEKISQEIDRENFYRVSRKVIMNIDSISEIVSYSRSKYLLKPSVSLPFEIFVSTDKIKKLKDWLDS